MSGRFDCPCAGKGCRLCRPKPDESPFSKPAMQKLGGGLDIYGDRDKPTPEPDRVPDWERLFRELCAAVEECDQKAIKHEGEDGFIRSYLLTTGPWHRVLREGRVRDMNEPTIADLRGAVAEAKRHAGDAHELLLIAHHDRSRARRLQLQILATQLVIAVGQVLLLVASR